MEKIIPNVKKKENIVFDFEGNSIEVNPIISADDMINISNAYILSFFKDGKDANWNVIFADFMLDREVLKYNTNIDVDSIESSEQLENIIKGELYSEILSHIENYDDLVTLNNLNLKSEIEKYKIEKSSGIVLAGIVQRFESLINDLSKLPPEEIENIKKTFDNPIKAVEKTPRKRHKKVVADVE
jgi:hypothetical protein